VTKALVVNQRDDPVAHWAVAPFRYFDLLLRGQLQLSARIEKSAGLSDIRPLIESNPSDVVFLTTSWRESPEDVLSLCAELDRLPRRPKLVYLDTFDQVTSPFFGIMNHVDLYLKKQVYRDTEDYERDYQGGSKVSDYICRRYGFDLGDWYFGSKIPEGQVEKLWLGWNLGSAPILAKTFLESWIRRPVAWSKRDVAVHYRVSSSEVPDWYSVHRTRLGEVVREFDAGPHGRVVVGVGKKDQVPLEQFLRELRHSKIVVSSFGWGEVTDRDFRVVSEGALLVKPDMAHVRTAPDIYQSWVTYVPIAWDGADLADRCRYYLEHPQAARAMAKAARQAYADWFRRRRFVDRIRDVLEHLHLG
jgi:hypothetical protein